MQLRLMLALLFVACITVLSGYLPYSDAASTERPYQFGFTIDGQQHRQEKKDERGIVMGEFGFITADGIYHVTVYATDEEGKFRILAMRSYPYEEHPKTIEMIVRPKAKSTTPKAIAPPTTTTERAKPKPVEKHNFSVQGCSGCFIKNNVPTTTTTTRKPEDKKYGIRPLSQPLAPEEAPQIGALPPSNTAKTATVGGIGGANAAKAPATTGINALPSAAGAPSAGTTGSTNGISTPKKQLTTPAVTAGNTGGGKGAAAGGGPNTNAGGFGAGSGSGGASGNSGGSKSGSSGAGGFKGGSSGGSTASETGDLYRFKYNLDYNGHRETGAYNGNKEGSFYAIGDDNVERTIEYIANEFGYQPRVRFRKLDAPVQAKENTLKDYEFVWFKKA